MLVVVYDNDRIYRDEEDNDLVNRLQFQVYGHIPDTNWTKYFTVTGLH